MTMLVLLSLLGCPACDDADGDEVCDDVDLCVGDDATGDADSDGVCDDSDVCSGDDSTGDSDGDAICDDRDSCEGDNSTGDADSDGICNDTDVCEGDNTTGDTDADGVCDDSDQCNGDDATGDSDSDGVCDDTDLCVGDNATGDTDGDGVCDDGDTCPLDDPNDTDGDGVCDTDDDCPLDEFDDSDGDGVCDSDDVCPGATDNSDGSCTLVLEALSSQDLWATIVSDASLAECPPAVGAYLDTWEETAYVSSAIHGGTGNPIEARGALSFDTSALPESTTLPLLATLRVVHDTIEGAELPVEVWGGVQPLFGATVDVGEFGVGQQLLASRPMSEIASSGFAEFTLPTPQINTAGSTQFVLQIDQDCPFSNSAWRYFTAQSTINRPTLTIDYLP